MWLLLLACADAPVDSTAPFDPAVYEAAGPYGVSARSLVVEDEARGRSLNVEVWAPAAASEGHDVLDFLTTGERRSQYEALLSSAPEGCPSTRAQATRDAAPAEGPWPLVLFSHCHSCTRFSSFTVAERLASHGFVVAAPDHDGDALWDELAGAPGELTTATLSLRGQDQQAVLEAALSGALGVEIDPDAVGAMGHSFGAVTTGWMLQEDPRVRAGLLMGAPAENPLIGGVSMEAIEEPMLFLLLVEDNSITELGNQLIRDNFEVAPSPSWKLELADAGHWSVSDLTGLIEGFMPGCGEDQRQTDRDEVFTYLDPATARGAAAATATAFFDAQLRGGQGAEYLALGRPEGLVDVEAR
ncbi:MAG: prolyl oligopeptidase family serine peptidase [Alphaproteobacteria bacterium]|nr:prolyl oligopeptidase family serine peptidase [Alphaproteobacteria bacterium]